MLDRFIFGPETLFLGCLITLLTLLLMERIQEKHRWLCLMFTVQATIYVIFAFLG